MPTLLFIAYNLPTLSAMKVVLYKRNKKDKKGSIAIEYKNNVGKRKYHFIGVIIEDTRWNYKTDFIKKSDVLYDEVKEKTDDAFKEFVNYGRIINPSKSKLTYSKLVEKFLKTQLQYSSHKTYKTNSKSFNNFLNEKYNQDDILLNSLTKDDILDYWIYLNSTYKRSTPPKYFRNFKVIINYGIDNDFFKPKYNLFGGIKIKEKKYQSVKNFISYDKFIDFFSLGNLTKKQDRVRLICGFQFYSGGLRISDALFLKYSDYTFDKSGDHYFKITSKKSKREHKFFNSVSISNVLTQAIYDRYYNDGDNKLVEKIILIVDLVNNYYQMKNTGGRIAIMDANKKLIKHLGLNNFHTFNEVEQNKLVLENYNEYLENTANFILTLFNNLIQYVKSKYGNNFFFDYLNYEKYENKEYRSFTKEDEQPIWRSTATINKQLKVLSKKANLDVGLTTHMFRHSFSNYIVSISGDLNTLKMVLGHSNLRTTQTYISIFNDKDLRNLNNEFNKSL